MNLNEVKTLIIGTVKAAFQNKKTLDKFDGSSGTLKYNGVPVNNVPVFVADDSPVGNIISFMGNTAPKDYLICDGSEYNIADYPLLVQHFIDEFGSANYFGGVGVDTFAVPDLSGEFLRGTGTAKRDSGSGSNVGKHQNPTSFPYIGTYATDKNMSDYWIGGYSKIGQVFPQNRDKDTDKTSIGIALGRTGNNITSGYKNQITTFTSRPTNTAVLYCIKYQITQNNISKDMVNYSLEEQVIGSWIDGKPLYQKVIETIASDAVTDGTPVITTVDISDLDIDAIAMCRQLCRSNSWTSQGVCHAQANPDALLKTYVGLNPLKLIISNSCINYNSIDVTVILQYTKTTDEENSFTPEMLSNISTLNTTASDEEVNEVIGGI